MLSSAGPPSLAAQPAPGPAPSPAAAGRVLVGSLRGRGLAPSYGDRSRHPRGRRGGVRPGGAGRPASCGLGWTTLAGIGWVESQHGTIGGRSLDAAGRPSTPILGPALDGSGPVAAIRANASSSRLHGDPDWDHAVGPMQFIPSTWETWGRDGDGDGTADPQDLDDAAAAAAAYLCGTGQDLTTGPGWSAAVYAYNHSARLRQRRLPRRDHLRRPGGRLSGPTLTRHFVSRERR